MTYEDLSSAWSGTGRERGIDVHGDRVLVDLAAGEVVRLDADQRGVAIRSLRGAVWVTQTNYVDDHVLMAEERFVFDHVGRIVVQALEDASVHIDTVKDPLLKRTA